MGAASEAAAFWQQAADLSATDDPTAAAADRERAGQALAAERALREAAGLDPRSGGQGHGLALGAGLGRDGSASR
jgi:hypothetical protein